MPQPRSGARDLVARCLAQRPGAGGFDARGHERRARASPRALGRTLVSSGVGKFRRTRRRAPLGPPGGVMVRARDLYDQLQLLQISGTNGVGRGRPVLIPGDEIRITIHGLNYCRPSAKKL